ncbi:MAG: hypothetical protein GY877_09685, partial [Hyphomicrobium sp.]|nr:hypothetical protein [Hyphomicrobium sp.]
ITFLRQKLKPPVGIEKPNLRHRAPPESICQASDSHKSEYGLFFEVPISENMPKSTVSSYIQSVTGNRRPH